MDSKQATRVPSGRAIGGVILALVLGLLLPFVSVLQISFLVPVLMLGGIFAVYLKARDGWMSAGTLIATELIATAYFLGAPLALMLLTAAVLPALYAARNEERKLPFFEQMNGGIIAYGIGLVAAMLIAYMSFGGGMVARFADLLRGEFARMPDAALQPLVDAVNSALTLSGLEGFEAVTVQAYRAQLSGVLDLMQQTYAEALPGTLLSGALLSGVLSVLWGNWTMARRGMATNESFIGMSRWFLPPSLSLGGLGLWLIGLILLYSGYGAGSTVYLTVCQLVGSAFAVQALAALDRRMLRAGRSVGRRKVLIGLLAALALLSRSVGTVLCYVGAASALFGSHGAVKRRFEDSQGHNSDHDDSNDE